MPTADSVAAIHADNIPDHFQHRVCLITPLQLISDPVAYWIESLGRIIASVCQDVLPLTEVEEVKDPVHGVFPVSGVVFQPQDQNLLPADHAQPVHQIHNVQANLQPDLKGAGERDTSEGIIPVILCL